MGTPDGVYDMIQRHVLPVEMIKVFVLDEADELLCDDLKEQTLKVCKLMPESTQCCIFCVLMPFQVVKDVTREFMRAPCQLRVEDDLTLDAVRKFYISLDKDEWKLETLCDLYSVLTITQAIVFCNTHDKVEWLAEQMKSREFTVSSMHGDMDPCERIKELRAFRSASSQVLITTDIFPRGLDIQQVSLIVNYDFPAQRDNYVHRVSRAVSRCGFGRKGVSIDFITQSDMPALRDVQNFYHVQIEEMPSNVADLL